MTSPRHDSLRALASLVALLGCGGSSGSGATYALTQPEPYPEHLAAGTHVRTIIIRSEDNTGTGPTRAGTSCFLDTLLFDVSTPTRIAPTTLDAASGCDLYTNVTPESQYFMESWICAGELTVGEGMASQGIGLCPSGEPGSYSYPFPCADLTPSAVTVTAGNSGFPNAVLTDLHATVSLPSPVTISQPTSLSITTWPAAGDLTVAWASAGATSAEVRIDSQGTGPSITIVCTPTTSGQQVIPASLLGQVASLRHQNALLRVVSVRDTMVTAEGGMPYRVSGATASSVLLQGLP